MNNNVTITEVEPSTKQDGEIPRHESGRFAPGNNANPTGKGGFGARPQDRSSGHWNKEESISYWYNKLLRIPEDEFDKFKPASSAQRIAWTKIRAATGDSEFALKCTKEITDRTEGRPKQDIDMNIESDNAVPLIKGFVIPTLPEDFIDKDIIEQAGEELGRKILASKN